MELSSVQSGPGSSEASALGSDTTADIVLRAIITMGGLFTPSWTPLLKTRPEQ